MTWMKPTRIGRTSTERRSSIILEREFLLAEMQSAEKNHPGERFFIRRDEISGGESSLGENSCWQRCNQQRRIILGREFLLAEMQSAEKNHPRKRILIRRDEISGKESSPEENSYWQRWNQRGRIILGREFLPAGMKSARKNHPRKRILIGRDEISVVEGIAFSELPSGEILNPTTFRIDHKGHWRAGYLQNKMPSSADRTIIRMGEGAAFRSLLQARWIRSRSAKTRMALMSGEGFVPVPV